jgi:hypothetical protein
MSLHGWYRWRTFDGRRIAEQWCEGVSAYEARAEVVRGWVRVRYLDLPGTVQVLYLVNSSIVVRAVIEPISPQDVFCEPFEP